MDMDKARSKASRLSPSAVKTSLWKPEPITTQLRGFECIPAVSDEQAPSIANTKDEPPDGSANVRPIHQYSLNKTRAQDPKILDTRNRKRGNHERSKLPSKPLTAYNLFFRDERARINQQRQNGTKVELEGCAQKSSKHKSILSNEISSLNEFGPSNRGKASKRPRLAQPTAADEHLADGDETSISTQLPPSTNATCKEDSSTDPEKEAHAAPFFQRLAKHVGFRWKHLSEPEKAKYKKMAADDMQRYRLEIQTYHENLMEETREKAAAQVALDFQSSLHYGSADVASIERSVSHLQADRCTSSWVPLSQAEGLALDNYIPASCCPKELADPGDQRRTAKDIIDSGFVNLGSRSQHDQIQHKILAYSARYQSPTLESIGSHKMDGNFPIPMDTIYKRFGHGQQSTHTMKSDLNSEFVTDEQHFDLLHAIPSRELCQTPFDSLLPDLLRSYDNDSMAKSLQIQQLGGIPLPTIPEAMLLGSSFSTPSSPSKPELFRIQDGNHPTMMHSLEALVNFNYQQRMILEMEQNRERLTRNMIESQTEQSSTSCQSSAFIFKPEANLEIRQIDHLDPWFNCQAFRGPTITSHKFPVLPDSHNYGFGIMSPPIPIADESGAARKALHDLIDDYQATQHAMEELRHRVATRLSSSLCGTHEANIDHAPTTGASVQLLPSRDESLHSFLRRLELAKYKQSQL